MPADEQTIKSVLQKNGFDLLYDKNQQLINQIKHIVEKGIREQFETGNLSFLPTERT